MTAIAELPGPRALPGIGNAHQTPAGPAARDDRAVGPALRAGVPVLDGPRAVVGFTDPEAINAILRERPDGYRRWREVEAVAEELGIDRPVHVRGRGLEAPAPARGDRAQHEPPAPLLRRHPDRQRAPADAPRAHAGRGRDPRRLHGLQRRRDVRAGLRQGPEHARARRRRAAGPHRAASSSCWPAGSSRRSRTGASSNRLPTAPPSSSLQTIQQRDRRASSPRRASAWRNGPSSSTHPENFLESMLAKPEYSEARRDRQRLHDAVRGRGHDREHARLGDLPARPATRRPSAASAAEADAVLGSDRTPQSAEAADAMRFAEAVFRESARLKSTAPIIFVEPNAGHRRSPASTCPRAPASSRSRASAGRPAGRALRPGPLAAPTARTPRRFLSFGAGPRFCPGRNLAFLEGKAALTMLARNFQRSSRTARRRASTSASPWARRACA